MDWYLLFQGLTAFGTVGACLLSLALCIQEYLCKISCFFAWPECDKYEPVLYISNLTKRMIVIREIRITYARKKICTIEPLNDPFLKSSAVLYPMSSKEMRLNGDVFKLSGNFEDKKMQKLTFEVITTGFCKTKTHCMYSYSDLYGLIIGNTFSREE